MEIVKRPRGRRSNINNFLLTYYMFIDFYLLTSVHLWAIYTAAFIRDRGFLCFSKSDLIGPLACTVAGTGVEVRVDGYKYRRRERE